MLRQAIFYNDKKNFFLTWIFFAPLSSVSFKFSDSFRIDTQTGREYTFTLKLVVCYLSFIVSRNERNKERRRNSFTLLSLNVRNSFLLLSGKFKSISAHLFFASSFIISFSWLFCRMRERNEVHFFSVFSLVFT